MNTKDKSIIGRRDMMKGAVASSMALSAGSLALGAEPNGQRSAKGPRRDSSLIQRENEKPGALDWQLTRIRLDKSEGVRSPLIEGYCSKQSVCAGESIDIMVSTDPAQEFVIEIFRTGYYGGRGARLMTKLVRHPVLIFG